MYNSRKLLNYPKNLIFDIYKCKTLEQLDGIMMVLPVDVEYTLEILFKTLTEREADVIMLLYKSKFSYEDVCKKYVVTRERIKQICNKALTKLQNPVRKNKLSIPTVFMEEFKILQEKYERYLEDSKCNACIHSFEPNKPTPETIRYMPIKSLDFSPRTYNCLCRKGVEDVEDIVLLYYRNQLLKIRNLGEKSYNEIKHKLIDLGITPRIGERYE